MCCICLSLWQSTVFAQATTHDVYLLADKQDEASKSTLIKALRDQFPAAPYNSKAEFKKNALIIAVGYETVEKLIESRVANPILAVGVSSVGFQDFVKKRDNLSAIYSDPSPEAQFHLMAAIGGRMAQQVAFFMTPRTEFLKPALQSAASSAGIVLELIDVTNQDDMFSRANRIQSRIVLMYPDATIFTSSSVRNLMLQLYRADRVLFGFSRNLVQAGAMGSTVPTDEGVARQAQEMVDGYMASGTLRPPAFSKSSKILLNVLVARSLNYVIKDEILRNADVVR
ncbi:type 1 periplasmic-binding domain-containing protein [Undibacterium oligocarboniphilum]|uniref:ABC transporter substrate-binding protein n=1 Tax=Undibacterium oligocarboniphilum TaxID=666702 RepID=A0A850QNK9_9BURK|nr:hypothetical protein [Undibacterium oligocarboniphilum]MBC3871461.1 hypothetical protein [Undibacterium oligocarboniphilum]NVO78963.1 hypothetical protein [Undibacterium oligocarboniphilum]